MTPPASPSAAAFERPEKRSLTLKGHRTSVSLEPSFWRAFQDIARREGRSVNDLAAEIDAARTAAGAAAATGGEAAGSLASALRVFILRAALEGRLGAR